jgi:hypothetical protein
MTLAAAAFPVVIMCKADPAKADNRTRSNWLGGIKRAPPGSPGASGAIRRCGDAQQEGDEAIISTNRGWLPNINNEDALIPFPYQSDLAM